MSSADLELLKANIDNVVELTFTDSTRELACIIFVFDEESDPDVFYDRAPKSSSGCGVRLSEIVSVRVP